MSMNALCGAGIGAVLMLLVQSNPAAAAAVTYAAPFGNDANPCTRSQPCKTMQGAFDKTDAGGEIFTLEPGSYGPLNAFKAITITGVDGASVDQVYIDAGAQDVVALTRLHFEAQANAALRFHNGKKLLVDECLMDSNGHYGFSVDPTKTSPQVIISNCRITNNDVGLRITPQNGKAVSVTLNNVQVTFNTSEGILSQQKAVTILNNSTIIYNSVAIDTKTDAKTYSFGNNVIAGDVGGNAILPLTLK